LVDRKVARALAGATPPGHCVVGLHRNLGSVWRRRSGNEGAYNRLRHSPAALRHFTAVDSLPPPAVTITLYLSESSGSFEGISYLATCLVQSGLWRGGLARVLRFAARHCSRRRTSDERPGATRP